MSSVPMHSAPRVLRFGPFVLDVGEHLLSRAGEPIALTPELFDLLTILATSGGRPMATDALIKAVWSDAVVEEGNLTEGMVQLRHALGDTGETRAFIETVPRVGYRFVAAVTDDDEGGAGLRAPALRDEAPRAETRYAKSGEVHIAYQVTGASGPDLVLVPGWVSHVEYAWEDPSYSRFLRRLASFSRLIMIDRRGTGLSDPVADLPSLEERMDDVRSVLDAVGSRQAALFGISEGGPMCMMFAATYPERTSGLILCGTAARITRSADYPYGVPPNALDKFAQRIVADWGSGISADAFTPSVAQDAAFRRSWARLERFAVSPAGMQALIRMMHDTDARHVLPAIRVPTLVLQRQGDIVMRSPA